MDLQELTTTIYPNMLKDQEAFDIMMASMQTVIKVYKNGKAVFAENEEQNKLIMAFLEKELTQTDPKMVLWYGTYRGDNKSIWSNPAEVEFWFFMHSLLIYRNLKEGYWGFMFRNVSSNEWKSVRKTLEPKVTA